MRILLPLLLGVAAAKRAAPCLPSGDERAINNALASGGKGASVLLCPGSVHNLNNSIHFTAPGQSLSSNAKGRDRALLVVQGPDLAVAIFADCKQCTGASISNLIIDGNRPQLLRVPGGGALIEIGNALDQSVTGCRLYEPRGWSALHVREGDSLNCRKAYIADNDIGPCGEEWDEEYDGLDEKEPPFGNPRADGISLACKDSVVERNTVFDATDGAIVLFGSAGSVVRENDIYSRMRVVLGGINLVDYDPWQGDYSNVRVHNNRLHANGRFFKVGIVVGLSSWSDDTDAVVYGATVTDNTFSGQYFGYALVVSSAHDFTVLRNKVVDGTQFIGVPGQTCPTAPENSPPMAFLINRGSAQGNYQPEFENGEVQHIICVQLPDDEHGPYRPWRFRDSPAAVAARAVDNAADDHIGVNLEASLADALVNYQANLLQAIRDVEARMRTTDSESHSDSHSDSHSSSEFENVDSTDIAKRISRLEDGGSKLTHEVDLLGRELGALARKFEEITDTQRPILQGVYNKVKAAKAEAKSEVKASAGESQRVEKPAEETRIEPGLNPLLLVCVGALMFFAFTFVQRRTGKKVKDMKDTE